MDAPDPTPAAFALSPPLAQSPVRSTRGIHERRVPQCATGSTLATRRRAFACASREQQANGARVGGAAPLFKAVSGFRLGCWADVRLLGRQRRRLWRPRRGGRRGRGPFRALRTLEFLLDGAD